MRPYYRHEYPSNTGIVIGMVELKTDTSIDEMYEAGQVVARALTAVREAADVGVSLLELDEIAHQVLRDAGAGSPFLGYRPSFAPVALPRRHLRLRERRDRARHPDRLPAARRRPGLASTSAPSSAAGSATRRSASPSARRAPPTYDLIETAERALAAGIEAAVVGNRIGDIAHAIGTVCRAAGYGIPDGFGGHGIGRRMHEDPPVPNEGRPGRGLPLRHGMVLAIEPMLIAAAPTTTTPAADGWTLRTNDGTRAAHAEHTVAITDAGPRILTAR